MNVVSRLRRSTGLTQAALAELAGTSQPTIAAYETGAKRPSLRTLQRLASAAGLDVHVALVPHLTREDRRSLALHERIADRLRAGSCRDAGPSGGEPSAHACSSPRRFQASRRVGTPVAGLPGCTRGHAGQPRSALSRPSPRYSVRRRTECIGARCRVSGVPPRRDAAMNRAHFEHVVRAVRLPGVFRRRTCGWPRPWLAGRRTSNCAGRSSTGAWYGGTLWRS